MTVATATSISLGLDCLYQKHDDLLRQMSGGKYDVCSVMPIPASIEEWKADHKTARKRAAGTSSMYISTELKREYFSDDIHEINGSMSRRQGRPMTSGYLHRQDYQPLPDYPCGRHATRITGVFTHGTCVAYLVMIRAGELALVSQILGHGDHLKNGIMYLLFQEALEREIEWGAGYVVYNRHDSGTDGLRFFKERLGFEETTVQWLP